MNSSQKNQRIQTHEAFEIVSFENQKPSNVILSAEHASNRLPPPWQWHPHDQYFVKSHWAYDLGARALTLELANQLECKAILSRFTRLLIDPNRSENSETLIRNQAEELPIKLNQNITAEEKRKRINKYYQPYHQAFDRLAQQSSAKIILSMHTFTPEHEGSKRDFEIGILFNQDEDLALELANQFRSDGLRTKLNEPYSGKKGFIHSVEKVSQKHNRKGIVIEIRNDLALQKPIRDKFSLSIAAFQNKLQV